MEIIKEVPIFEKCQQLGLAENSSLVAAIVLCCHKNYCPHGSINEVVTTILEFMQHYPGDYVPTPADFLEKIQILRGPLNDFGIRFEFEFTCNDPEKTFFQFTVKPRPHPIRRKI